MTDKWEEWEKRDADPHYITCIGTDGLKHICYPWEDKCYCGEEVWRKKLLRDDHLRDSCWECTY